MKKIIALLSVLVLVGCEGSTGPQGPKGDPGDPVVGQGFEVQANFNSGNDYARLFKFAKHGAKALNTDIVAVYWFDGVDENTGNDIWRPLPASVFFEDGAELQYGFDHTLDDVNIYLTGDVDLSTLDTGFTQDQLFRVAILPIDYVQSNKIDVSNMNEVRAAIDNKGFRKVNTLRLK